VIQVSGIEPKFITRPKINGVVKNGDEVIVRCEIRADPAPQIQWKLGDVEIDSKDKNFIIAETEHDDFTIEYLLTIKSIQTKHNGKGQISAKNILAEVTCPFSVIVENSTGMIKN
jgi:hypothetical protein